MNLQNILGGIFFLLLAAGLAVWAWLRDKRRAYDRGFDAGYNQAEREGKDKARKLAEAQRRDALWALHSGYVADLGKTMSAPPQWWVVQTITARGKAPVTTVLETGVGTNQFSRMPQGAEGPYIVGVWPVRTDGHINDIKTAIRTVSAMRADDHIPGWMEKADLNRLWDLFPPHLRRAVATEDASPETMAAGSLVDPDTMVTYLRSTGRYLVLKRGESVRPMIMLLEEAGYTVTPPPPRTTGETSVQVSATPCPGEQPAVRVEPSNDDVDK